MSKTETQTLRGVAETSLITLYIRAMESQRPDALIKDEKAVELLKRMSSDERFDFSRVRQIPLSEANKLVIILRVREFDRYVKDFLRRHPEAIVVHIGCGFDTRFERMDNGQVEWYDLDLPDVVELRRQVLGGLGGPSIAEGRHHLLGCSVFDNAWLDAVAASRLRPFLFLAEGVFMYFKGIQVKRLVLTLCDRFPGAELVFDAYSPVHVWRHNLQMSTSKIDFPIHWGIWHGQELERWGAAGPTGAGIRLLGEWGFFDCPEPRLAPIRWARWIESLARTMRIYHFQLGETAG